jgi:acyl-homoserine lactone acylase PvdQ
MAKDAEGCERLKGRPRTPGFRVRNLPDEVLKFSQARAADGTRTPTGKPLLESDPQTSVNNPPLWDEFHIEAGRHNVRRIGFAGAPALPIGFNAHIAWGLRRLEQHLNSRLQKSCRRTAGGTCTRSGGTV